VFETENRLRAKLIDLGIVKPNSEIWREPKRWMNDQEIWWCGPTMHEDAIKRTKEHYEKHDIVVLKQEAERRREERGEL
jgi:hypothetical protein